MDKIIAFSTTSSLTYRIKKVLESLGNDMPVYECTLDEAYEIAKNKISEGTEVLICRGGTAEYLRRLVDVPVVDIRHGFLDIYRAIKNTGYDESEIGVIGYSNLCEATKLYNETTEKNVSIYEVFEVEDFAKNVEKAIEDNKKCLIGGFQLEKICDEKNIKYIPGDADEIQIVSAIKEAYHDLKIGEERKKRLENIINILENMSEGIMSFDRNGDLNYINKNMSKIIGEINETNLEKFKKAFNVISTLKLDKAKYNSIVEYNGKRLIYNTIPFNIDQITHYTLLTVQEVENIKRAEQKIRQDYISRGYYAKHNFDDLWGSSQQLLKTIDRAKKYANSESTVLIMGETGTGKEIFAQSIHNNSVRRKSQFVAINCAALPENILESELFGYVKGAFTGASGDGKEGIFEIADGGTVFLDEISELPLNVQAKLLRVIQEREICRLGDNKVRRVDVRLITAANKNLFQLVSEGKFREDLYYRICVLELKIPPLRERADDCLKILKNQLELESGRRIIIEGGAAQFILSYDWPGNVREVLNISERLNLEIENGVLNKYDLENVMNHNNIKREMNIINVLDEKINKNNDEKEMIEELLEKYDGDRTKIASELGMSTTTLWRRIKKYGIEVGM